MNASCACSYVVGRPTDVAQSAVIFQSSLYPGLLFHLCNSAYVTRFPVKYCTVSSADRQYVPRTSTSTPSTSKIKISGCRASFRNCFFPTRPQITPLVRSNSPGDVRIIARKLLQMLRPCGCAIFRAKFGTKFAAQNHPYQILQEFSRTIASPFLQPNAFANASMLEIGPIPRKRASGCGSVFVCSRAASALWFVPHTCAHPRKNLCSGVNPSMLGGRLPAIDFSYAA